MRSRSPPASPRKTPLVRSRSPPASSMTVSGDDAKILLIATSTIKDDDFVAMCSSSPEMKKACGSGLLGERLDSIKSERRTGVSSFKSSVAHSLLHGDADELYEYAAALDDKGFNTLIKDPALLSAIKSNPLLASRADSASEDRSYKTTRKTSQLNRDVVRRSLPNARKTSQLNEGDYDGDVVRRSLPNERSSQFNGSKTRFVVPKREVKVLDYDVAGVRETSCPCKSAVPIHKAILTGDILEDARTLAQYSSDEMREYINDSRVAEVIMSPEFSAARAEVLRRSNSPVRSPTKVTLSNSRSPIRQPNFSRNIEEFEETTESE